MMRKHWFPYSFALSAALLSWQGSSLYAQSSNYAISVSPLPAQVGQSLTVTAPVPATVPDNTGFNLAVATPTDSYQYSGVSLNHKLVIQVPALTVPGLYEFSVSQTAGYVPVGTSTSLALNSGTIDLLVSAAGQTLNAAATFTGQYSFLFKGETAVLPGKANGLATVGTFTSDGNGHITSGTLDVNSATGINLQNIATTGTYQLDGTGKGTLLLTTPQGPLSFNFFVPGARPGVIANDASIVPVAGFTGTGEISRTTTFFNYGIVFENPDNPYGSLPLVTSVGFSEEAGAGGFAFGAGLLLFQEDLSLTGTSQAIPGSPDIFTGAAGTYSDQYTATGLFTNLGRSTMTLSTPGQPSTTPNNYVFYQGSVGSSGLSGVTPVLYFLSLDPHPATSLVVGKVRY